MGLKTCWRCVRAWSRGWLTCARTFEVREASSLLHLTQTKKKLKAAFLQRPRSWGFCFHRAALLLPWIKHFSILFSAWWSKQQINCLFVCLFCAIYPPDSRDNDGGVEYRATVLPHYSYPLLEILSSTCVRLIFSVTTIWLCLPQTTKHEKVL